MDIRKLRYFVTLAEELHFRRAAERLCISQPPLSSAIRSIEDELGTALFVRNSKRVSLTPAGAAFYHQALKVMAQLEMACATVKEIGLGNRGQLDISFVSGMSLRGVPEVVRAFGASHPQITISLREMGSYEQVHAILEGNVAAGFFHHSGALHPDLHRILIGQDAFICCVPQDHRLAGSRHLDLRELAEENFIFFSREASPASHDGVIAVCAAAGFSPTIRHHVTRWITALLLVSRGVGVALVPESFAGIGLPNIAFLDVGSPTRSMSYFAWRRDSDHAGLQEFVDLVRSSLAMPETVRTA